MHQFENDECINIALRYNCCQFVCQIEFTFIKLSVNGQILSQAYLRLILSTYLPFAPEINFNALCVTFWLFAICTVHAISRSLTPSRLMSGKTKGKFNFPGICVSAMCQIHWPETGLMQLISPNSSMTKQSLSPLKSASIKLQSIILGSFASSSYHATCSINIIEFKLSFYYSYY